MLAVIRRFGAGSAIYRKQFTPVPFQWIHECILVYSTVHTGIVESVVDNAHSVNNRYIFTLLFVEQKETLV